MREALFNIWADQIPGCRFLDLFAGSGAMGLEALSRGASRVTWAEKDGGALQAIRRNLEDLAGAEDVDAQLNVQLQVLRLDLPRQADRLGPGWDLIYADPPYAFDAYPELVQSVAPLLASNGELAVEHSHRLDEGVFADAVFAKAPTLSVVDRRTWGDCAVTFLRMAEGPTDGPAVEFEEGSNR